MSTNSRSGVPQRRRSNNTKSLYIDTGSIDPYQSSSLYTEENKLVRARSISPIDIKSSPHLSTIRSNISSPLSASGQIVIQSPNIWKNFVKRATWSVVMIASFLGLLLAGHKYVILLVCIIQTMIFKEIISIAHIASKQKNLPWFRTLSWYFLFTTLYFLYGESLIHYFKKSVLVDAFFSLLATHHRFISFILYMIGIILFVTNLKKGFYKFQFGQLAWTHMALILAVCQIHLVINNIFEGLIWFVLPVSLVIVNDIAAYLCGIAFGRTPLIRLSPKKTWEGFIGAFIFTFIFGFFFSRFLANYDHMICKVQDWNMQNNSQIIEESCERDSVFQFQAYNLPRFMIGLLKRIPLFQDTKSIRIAPIQFHALAFSIFASLIAPFGGFLASGFKRAFKIKDFSDSIPGHGGVTDRMDCQIIMGTFSYMYISSFIHKPQITVANLLYSAVNGLSIDAQLELYRSLEAYLVEHGILPEHM